MGETKLPPQTCATNPQRNIMSGITMGETKLPPQNCAHNPKKNIMNGNYDGRN